MTSLATQLFRKITSTLAVAQTVVNAGIIITVKFAPQLVKNLELQDTSQKSVVSLRSHIHEQPKPPQTSVNQIDTKTNKSNDEVSVIYITSYQQLFDQV